MARLLLNMLSASICRKVLLLDEKSKLIEEYITLKYNIETFISNSNKQFKSEEPLCCAICTDENLYKECNNVRKFALSFLSRSFNEYIVESQFSEITDVDDSSRMMDHQTVSQLCFIRCNGPSPVNCKHIVKEALTNYFNSKPWKFTVAASRFFISSVDISLLLFSPLSW